MRIDGSTWFVFVLLLTGALFGFGALFGGIALLVSAFWQDHKFKQEQEAELKEEQRLAVAVAEALVIQHYYDQFSDDNGSGQGARV